MKFEKLLLVLVLLLVEFVFVEVFEEGLSVAEFVAVSFLVVELLLMLVLVVFLIIVDELLVLEDVELFVSLEEEELCDVSICGFAYGGIFKKSI
jgi:hypothetical protein